MTSFANIVAKSLPVGEIKVNNSGLDIKQKVANILGISNNDQWEIVDSIPDEGLYMIHYSETSNLELYGNLRGTIVDVKVGIIIRKGIGYTPTVTLDELKLKEDTFLELIDENEKVHILNNFMITRGFEDTTISAFKHNGKVYHSTNKRIDSSKSKWGGSKTFKELYYEVGGLQPEELFHPQTVNSPFVYEFLIVHPSLLNVSKIPVGTGFIVSLGVKTMWDLQNTPYRESTNPKIDFIIKSIPGTDKLPLNPEIPVVYTPTNIDLATANAHLQYGFYDPQDYTNIDHRLVPGEFVIIYSLNGANEVIRTYKVQSNSYAWRWNTRSNDPNIKHRLYQLSSLANGIPGTDPELLYESFVEMFPVMEPYEIKELKEMIKDSPIIVYPQMQNFVQGDYSTYLDNSQKRFYNIFLCLFASIPLHLQSECLELYDEFIQARHELIGWLRDIAKAESLPEDEKYYRVKNIIIEARKQARFKLSAPKSPQGGRKSFPNMVNIIIYNFIHRERGDSLYKLVKLMREK
jgi:hypothetical protein